MDLSLISIDELCEELMKRGSCGIVMITNLESKQIYHNWIGEYHEALGLTIEMQDVIKLNKEKE